MEKEKLAGSTMDLCEMVVDYKNDKTEIKDVPPENIFTSLQTALIEWGKFLFLYLFLPLVVIIAIINYLFDINLQTGKIALISYLSLTFIFVLLHLNKKLDKKFKKFFAKSTVFWKKSNRATFTDFKTKEFMIPNVANICLEYDTTDDVKNQLSKVWVKQEQASTVLLKQAQCKDILLSDPDAKVWNAYFIFEEIPKDGELIVRWI